MPFSNRSRGNNFGGSDSTGQQSSWRAGKSAGGKLARIKELEAMVKQLTKERNSLREEVVRLQNLPTVPNGDRE